MLVAAAIALLWANSPWSDSYYELWATPLRVELGDLIHLDHLSLQTWVNDALMAVFFLLVGVEIKREVVHGDLPRHPVGRPADHRRPRRDDRPGGDLRRVQRRRRRRRRLGHPDGHRHRLRRRRRDPARQAGAARRQDLPAHPGGGRRHRRHRRDRRLLHGRARVGLAGGRPRRPRRHLPDAARATCSRWRRTSRSARSSGWRCSSSGVHATLAGVALGLLTPAWPLRSPRRFPAAARRLLDRIDKAYYDRVLTQRGVRGERAARIAEVARLAMYATSPLERLRERPVAVGQPT